MRGAGPGWSRWGWIVLATVFAVLGSGLPASGALLVPEPWRARTADRGSAQGPSAEQSFRTSERSGRPKGPKVLIIGDSTTVHMQRRFAAALKAEGLAATVDARSGRTTQQGRWVLARYQSEAYDYVVVLLGANGRRADASRDIQALRALGVDVMATVQTPRQAKVNRAVRRAFGSQAIPWAKYANDRGIRPTDGKHYTKAGYRVRARYLAHQIAKRVREAPPGRADVPGGLDYPALLPALG